MERTIGGHVFELIGPLEPERAGDGKTLEFLPQARYRNSDKLDLNRHGTGPFCRFHTARTIHLSGVYAISIDDSVLYVGECQDLAKRFGSNGYGGISPRNCFLGGQSTNCKVNHLIFDAAQSGREILLWFMATTQRKIIEGALIRDIRPSWNSRTPRTGDM